MQWPARQLARTGQRCWLQELAGCLPACPLVWLQGGSDLVLLTLVVRADVRQQGVGRMLLQALLEHARQAQASG